MVAPDQVIISFLDADFNKRGEHIKRCCWFHIFFLALKLALIYPFLRDPGFLCLWSDWADDARTGGGGAGCDHCVTETRHTCHAVTLPCHELEVTSKHHNSTLACLEDKEITKQPIHYCQERRILFCLSRRRDVKNFSERFLMIQLS